MLSLTVLGVWTLSGAITAMLMSRPDEGRYAWVPIAVFVGPLWMAIAAERSRV